MFFCGCFVAVGCQGHVCHRWVEKLVAPSGGGSRRGGQPAGATVLVPSRQASGNGRKYSSRDGDSGRAPGRVHPNSLVLQILLASLHVWGVCAPAAVIRRGFSAGQCSVTSIDPVLWFVCAGTPAREKQQVCQLLVAHDADLWPNAMETGSTICNCSPAAYRSSPLLAIRTGNARFAWGPTNDGGAHKLA